MRQSIAVLSFLAGVACADDVLSFVFPGGIDGSAVATVLSANPSTTSAIMACPTGTPIDECGLAAGLDVEIIGGTRYQASMSAGTVYVSYGCDGYNSAAKTMTCTAEMSGEDPQTAVLSGSDVAFITASVVEGAELLSGGASATASASASASASPSVTPKSSAPTAASSGMQTSATPSGTAAAGSHASGSHASSTGSSAAPASTGAAVRFGVEGAALLALAGAAAVNVL